MRLQAQAGFILFAVLTATITEAQSAPVRPQHPRRGTAQAANSSASAPSPATPPPAVPTAATSLLDQPAKPAQVQLNAGNLSIKADNSTLSGILHDISAKTGMTVDGLSRDQRIFGTYGPAAPREVLSALLDGLDYNVMMVGSLDNGAPRQLALTPRTTGASGSGNQTPMMRQPNPVNNNNDEEDDSSVPQDQPQDNSAPPNPQDTGQQPQDQPQPQNPSNSTPSQPSVRTPQQMLQELQQLRQQGQQPQPQQNPQ